jgi:hypothetical protein
MVRFGSFTLVVLFTWSAIPCAGQDVPDGFTPLFNGRDLTGWKPHAGKLDSWTVEDGLLKSSGKGGGWLFTGQEYSDCEIRLEFRLSVQGNSGVALRAPRKGDPAFEGLEVQILDDPNYKGLRPTQHAGSIYDVVAASKQVLKPTGEWNTLRIIAKGRQVIVELNGTQVVDANLDDLKEHYPKHPGLLRDKGHVGLQNLSKPVEFKYVWIKPL